MKVVDPETFAVRAVSLAWAPALAAHHQVAIVDLAKGTPEDDTTVGTDHFDFLLEGVPTFVANQREANYLINYHAMSDTFDKVNLAELKKHVAEAAALSFDVADAPKRIGPRLTRAQIEEILKEAHLDEQMKIFGMWQAWQRGTLRRTA